MRVSVGISLLTTVLLVACDTTSELSEYEKQYSYQMGTEPINVPDLNTAIATIDAGAVYANRHMTQFPVTAWNFSPSSQPFSFKEDIKPLSDDVIAHLQATNTDAYIVVKDGVIIHEYYAKGMHPTTKHATFSAGKSWTSAAWHEQTLPNMSKSVGDLLPEVKGSYIGDQLLRHIVDMRVPINWGIDYSDPNSTINQFALVMGWEFESIGDNTFDFFRDLTKDPAVEAGTPEERMFQYVDGNTALAGIVGPRIAGVHAYEGLRQFYDQLGLEYVSGTVASLHGHYSGEGGQFFTLRDFVKLPYALSNGGKVGERQVLSEAYLADILTADPGKQAAWTEHYFAGVYKDVTQYSNYWYVIDENTALASGSYGQFNIFDIENGVAIAKFSTYPKNADKALFSVDSSWLAEQVAAY